MHRKPAERDVEYESDLTIVIAKNSDDEKQAKVHQTKSLDSFSKSSESLAMPVSKVELIKPKKTRSSSRPVESKVDGTDDDIIVSRDRGESYLTNVLQKAQKMSGKKSLYGGGSVDEEERLRLNNIRLESKLTKLSNENEIVIGERAMLKSELESVRQDCGDRHRLQTILETKLAELTSEQSEKDGTSVQLRIGLTRVQDAVTGKTVELEAANAELARMKERLCGSEKKCARVRDSCEEKGAIVEGLKKRLAEVHAELDLTRLAGERSDCESVRTEAELETMLRGREAMENQLAQMQGAQEELQKRVAKLRQSVAELGGDKSALETQRKELRLRLMRFKETKLHEMTELLRRLEEAQKALVCMTDAKQALDSNYETLLERFEMKSSQLEAERQRSRKAEMQASELQDELHGAAEELERAHMELGLQEVGAGELRGRLAQLEGELAAREEETRQLEAEKVELTERVRQETQVSVERQVEVVALSEQLGGLHLAWTRVSEERNQAYSGVANLREEIDRVVEQFDATRRELWAKEQAVQAAEEQCEEVRCGWREEAEKATEHERQLAELIRERGELLGRVEALQREHGLVVAELESMRSCLGAVNERVLELEAVLQSQSVQLQTERDNSRAELEALKQELGRALEQLEQYSGLQHTYGELLAKHEQLERGYHMLAAQHEETSMRLQQELSGTREELARTEEASVATERQRQRLSSDLESLRFSHTVDLAANEERFREELDRARKEFSDMVQEKIRCEAAIGNLQHHVQQLSTDYEGKLSNCRGKMLTLQRQSSEFAEVEGLSRSLKEELERKRGELEAVLESLRSFKRHVEHLETRLAAKEAELMKTKNAVGYELKEREMQLHRVTESVEGLEKLVEVEKELRNKAESRLSKKELEIERLVKKIDVGEEDLSGMNEQLKCGLEEAGECRHRVDQVENMRESLQHQLRQRDDELKSLLEVNKKLKVQLEEGGCERSLGEISLQKLLAEVEDRKQQLEQEHHCQSLKDEGYQREMEAMKNFIQEMRSDRDSLSRQIELTAQQDIVATAVLSSLRAQLSGILFRQKHQEEDTNTLTLGTHELAELKRLLADTAEADFSAGSKHRPPFGYLSECIEDLRSQIDTIQSDIAIEMESYE